MKIHSRKISSVLAGGLAVACLTGCAPKQAKTAGEEGEKADFVTVRDGKFAIGDSAYRYIGTNFWYGPILASDGRGGEGTASVSRKSLTSSKSLA